MSRRRLRRRSGRRSRIRSKELPRMGVRRAAFDGEEGEDVLEEEREIHEEVQACDHFLHPKC